MAALVVNGLDVQTLSDDEIFLRLKEMGVFVGPIVESTREVYQRKLHRLLTDGCKELNGTQTQTQNHQSPVAGATLAPASANHGILKSPDDVPRIRTSRRSVTMAPSTSTPQPQQPAKKFKESVEGVNSKSFEYQYFNAATPRQGLHTGGTPTNTTLSSEFHKSRMSSTSNKTPSSYRETILYNANEKKLMTNGSQLATESSLKKNNPLFVTIFEVFVISFLVIVGYVFYQEVISFTQAEKEFVESNA